MLGLSGRSLWSVALAAGLCAGPTAEPPVVEPPVAEAPADEFGALDVLAYRLSVDVGPDPAAFRAEAEITALVVEDGAERLRFDLVGLTIDSVTVGGSPARGRRDERSLAVELGRPATTGDTIVVKVFYGGTPEDGLIFKENIYGRSTVFADNWPARARYWFPGIDHPGDKATVEFRVRAPEGWRVVAVGERVVEEEPDDGRRVTVWRTDRPIPVYTMVMGAGEMSVVDLGSLGCDAGSDSCIPLTAWVFPEDEEGAAQIFARTAEIVAFFDSLIGPFPYEKLALVQSSTRFGGMENSSAIFLFERVMQRGSVDGLLAHEIAHQWFGDAVTEREWPHVWLSEGFATYFGSVFFEFAEGDSAAAARMARSESSYMRADAVDRPIVDVEPENLFRVLNANSYQKGAWVLHMLRRQVGDQAFFDGIRRYYSEYLHATALSADLQRIMEDVSGQELGWFFDQWLYRPGYPQVEVRSTWNEESKSLALIVTQVQSWPAFRFPLEIEVVGDGFEERRTLWIEGSESRHDWVLPSAPSRVEADPRNNLLGPAEVAG
jgi:aminopeptidase N